MHVEIGKARDVRVAAPVRIEETVLCAAVYTQTTTTIRANTKSNGNRRTGCVLWPCSGGMDGSCTVCVKHTSRQESATAAAATETRTQAHREEQVPGSRGSARPGGPDIWAVRTAQRSHPAHTARSAGIECGAELTGCEARQNRALTPEVTIEPKGSPADAGCSSRRQHLRSIPAS